MLNLLSALIMFVLQGNTISDGAFWWRHLPGIQHCMETSQADNTRHPPIVGLMLVQRHRRWSNNNPTLGGCLVFDETVELVTLASPVVWYHACRGCARGHTLRTVSKTDLWIRTTRWKRHSGTCHAPWITNKDGGVSWEWKCPRMWAYCWKCMMPTRDVSQL